MSKSSPAGLMMMRSRDLGSGGRFFMLLTSAPQRRVTGLIRSSSANQERGLAVIWTEADETDRNLCSASAPRPRTKAAEPVNASSRPALATHGLPIAHRCFIDQRISWIYSLRVADEPPQRSLLPEVDICTGGLVCEPLNGNKSRG